MLVNPYSQRGEQERDRVLTWLRQTGLDLDVLAAPGLDNLAEQIAEYGDRVDRIIVAGGDGTINAALPGVLRTGKPLGVIPLGTANSFAQTVGIPENLPQACRAIAGGRVRYVDVCQVNDRYFLNAASLGLSVNLTQQLTRQMKRRWGILSYGIAGVQVLRQARPFIATVTCNGEQFRLKTVQITVGNGRFYGGGMVVAADAAIDDHRLDLCSLRASHWWEILLALPALWRGQHHWNSRLQTLQGQHIDIELEGDRQYDINTDGEITTHTPARFLLLRAALPVLVPR
jgi:YegS/Rv2252/BmrU family lipid kinase